MGAWLGVLIGGIGDLLTAMLAKKTIFATAVVTGFLSLTTAFIVALHGLESAVVGVAPSWAVGLGYLIPDNGATCFSVCVAARIARWIYDYHKDVLKTAVTA